MERGRTRYRTIMCWYQASDLLYRGYKALYKYRVKTFRLRQGYIIIVDSVGFNIRISPFNLFN